MSIWYVLLRSLDDFLGPFWGDEKEVTDPYLLLDPRLVTSCWVMIAAVPLPLLPTSPAHLSIVKEQGSYSISCWHGDVLYSLRVVDTHTPRRCSPK